MHVNLVVMFASRFLAPSLEPLDRLILCIVICGPPPYPVCLVLNITLSFLTITPITCGLSLFVLNPTRFPLLHISLLMLLLSWAAPSKACNVITVVSLTTHPHVPSFSPTESISACLAPIPHSKMVKLSVFFALSIISFAPSFFRHTFPLPIGLRLFTLPLTS